MNEIIKGSKPFFSIGVTTYNRIDGLRETINSLITQKFKNIEIIIGNDYIEQELTYDVLEVFDSRIKIINNSKNLGELENMNSILKYSNGEYFTWVYDDDPCSTSFLESAYFAIEEHKNPTCVYTSFIDFYGLEAIKFQENEALRVRKITGDIFLKDYLRGGIACLGCSGIFKKSYLDNIGGAPRISQSKIALYTEYALIMKVCQEKEIIYIDNKLVSARNHIGSWSVYNNDLDLFKDAGIGLIDNAIEIFTHPSLINNFNCNLKNLNKSILGAVIIKIIGARKIFDKKEYAAYLEKVLYVIGNIPNEKLRNIAVKDLEKIQSLNIFHIFKGYIKIYVHKNILFKLMRFKSLLKLFKYKSF